MLDSAYKAFSVFQGLTAREEVELRNRNSA